MASSLKKLKKFSRMSRRELLVRGGQEASKWSELLFRTGCGEMSDAAWRREHEAAREAVGSAALEARGWFPSFDDRREIVELMRRRFPAERLAIIDRAERARAGRFDLLGERDLSFGDPIDWRLEPTSGRRTGLDHWSRIDFLRPEIAGDKKFTWELNRCQHFVAFGQAYWMTGEEKYAAAFVAQAEAWMDANPPKRGINWASSLELAFRSISWLWALRLCAGSPALSERFLVRLQKVLIAHGRHLETYLSYYFSPNTHLTGEALGLFYLGIALPGLRSAARWRELGLQILIEQAPIHVQPDGVYFEQSSYYHRYTADFYTQLWLLSEANGIELPAIIAERLELLLDHLMWITRPDGSSPFYGDDDGGVLLRLGDRPADDFRETLATGAALFKRSDWKYVAGPAAVETLWLMGPAALASYDDLPAEPPRETARAFRESGYFVMRDGWESDSAYLLIDCGRHGGLACGHAHADALSFEFAAAGVNWIIDPGTFTYTGDAQARDYFRSTRGHNCAVVDGEGQSTPDGPFSWSSIAEATAIEFEFRGDFRFTGAQSGFERFSDPVGHQRVLEFKRADARSGAPARLIVTDQFSAHQRRQYEIIYHFSAGCRAVCEANLIRVVAPDGAQLLIAAMAMRGREASRPLVRIEPGWVSRCYGSREAAPIAVIESDGVGDHSIVSIIIPVGAGATRSAEAFIADWLLEMRSPGSPILTEAR